MMNTRNIVAILQGQPASDGAGVRLTRLFGPGQRLDPFLMLDAFDSSEAADYIGGFPPHPHRGFETVTYMLEGEMLHEDHLGNQGRLTPGAVQWMTAARGIIHSEMPQQIEGRMRGFQLWLNLPAAEKMKDPAYRDIPPQAIPEVAVPGGRIKVIAGHFAQAGGTVSGPVAGGATDPLYLDLDLQPESRLAIPVTPDYTALLYVYEGQAEVGDQPVQVGRLAVLGEGEQVALSAGGQGLRALLLAARPLKEPVAAYGPFVMNTAQEIEQALQDYRDGRLTAQDGEIA
jgi:redox-sensitive bicupin YhaK (pirin superfamily)